MHISFDHCPELSLRDRNWLAAALPPLGLLADVIAWGVSLSPSSVVSAVHVQDEYTHDVLLPIRRGLVLVFDTT